MKPGNYWYKTPDSEEWQIICVLSEADSAEFELEIHGAFLWDAEEKELRAYFHGSEESIPISELDGEIGSLIER